MPKMRSFNNLNGKRGRKRTDMDAGNGYNSLGGRRTGASAGLQNDASSGMRRDKSQAGSTRPGGGSKKA